MWILFRRKNLKEDGAREAWLIGSNLYCRNNGDIVLMHRYLDGKEAGLDLRYLLYKLRRISKWI